MNLPADRPPMNQQRLNQQLLNGQLTAYCHSRGASTRREFLTKSGLGFGALAAGWMLQRDLAARELTAINPLAARPPHFAAKARQVIFLFMHGGPSHLDTFDPKPELDALDGQSVPESFGSVELQFTKVERVPLLASRRKFARRGQSGLEISDLFPHTAEHADDLAVIRSCHHDGFTHVTGQNWMNTGWARVGRPSVGAWTVYGLGSENENLPAYVVMLDGGIKAGSPAYGAGFLPAMYQGTVLRSEGPPILNVKRPAAFSAAQQRELLDMLQWYNQRHLEPRQDDTELSARLAAYELAFRMQTAVPELTDLSDESAATEHLYGLDQPTSRGFGMQCLLARRMVERGVRFIQLYSGGNQGGSVGWDGHQHLDKNHLQMAQQVNRPIAGLLQDLKQRGLLDSTLVIWGGEFGRTPFTDGAEGGNRQQTYGRDHNPYGFTVWMAGGGIQGGRTIGATDEIGLRAVDDKVHMHDLHATILSLLGLDHELLTYFFQGRDFRLTDVGGENNLAARLLRAS